MSDPLTDMGERIRRIVCTTVEEATAKTEIDKVIAETARELGIGQMFVNLEQTKQLLRMPIRNRVKKLRQRGYVIPREWSAGQ